MAQARQVWCQSQAHLDPAQLVFIDETSVNTQMVRRYGRYWKKRRLIGKVPHGHYKTTTFIAVLHQTHLSAPLVLEGPMNGEAFHALSPLEVHAL